MESGGSVDGPGPSPRYGVVPSREAVCGVRHQFQGMSIALPPSSTFDSLMAQYWFDPTIAQMTALADRMAVYKAHRDVGDTHILLSLDTTGLAGLAKIIAIAREAVTIGGLTGVILMCMGDGHGQPNSDPGALGQDWLMQNFRGIYLEVLGSNDGDIHNTLAHRTIFVPGFDGVVPDWQPPSSVDRFLLMTRDVIDRAGAGYLGLELSAGYCVWGDEHAIEGNNWSTPAGRAVDVILQEGPIAMGPPVPVPAGPPQVEWTQVYQIVGRMVQPFTHVPGQTDDLHAPYLLGGGTPRGPFYYVFWEYDTYQWTLPWRHGSGGMSQEQVESHRQAAYAMGCRYVG